MKGVYGISRGIYYQFTRKEVAGTMLGGGSSGLMLGMAAK